VPIPDGIDDKTATSVMMQGLTASHFATDFYSTQPGDIAFVHAAAGGLGLLLTQIIKLRGGKVIGRVSSMDKVAVAKAAGADHVIVATDGKFVEKARQLSGGEGVHVVFDGSGPSTFQGSLDVLRRSGTFCWYGPVLCGPGPLDIMSLPKSIKLGYAVFFDHIHTPELLRAHSARLFDWYQVAVHTQRLPTNHAMGTRAGARGHAAARLDRTPEASRLRRQTVENPFGTLKAWMGSTHFLTKTLPRVRTEMSSRIARSFCSLRFHGEFSLQTLQVA
jgi:NADPH2:quinone reductase